MSRSDAVIFGGGTAGAMAALSLASAGLRVLSVDGARRPGRPLLELAAPAAMQLLAAAGLPAELTSVRPCHEIAFLWGSPAALSRNYLFEPYGPAGVVDQARLRVAIARAARQAGASFLRARVSGLSRCRGKWTLDLRKLPGGPLRSVVTPFVVDATGRASCLARRIGAVRASHDRLTALVAATARAEHREVPEDQFLVESCPAGWFYSAGLADGRLAAAFLTDTDLLRGSGGPGAAFAAGLRDTTATRSRFARVPEGRPLRPLRTFAAGSSRLHPAAGQGWIAIGDAAIGFDPLAGHGISHALQSAVQAAAAVCGSPAGLGQYEEWTSAVWGRYLTGRRAAYAAEWRWPDSAFWSRRPGTAG